MGLATIDSRSQKEHTEIHKIPKFAWQKIGWHLLQIFFRPQAPENLLFLRVDVA